MSNERKRLSEIFLDELDAECSDESALVAIIKCDGIFREELGIIEMESDPIAYLEYFFTEKDDTFVYSEHSQELFDLWDVFAEYSEAFGRLNSNPDLIILRIILEIQFTNHQIQIEYLKKNLSEAFCKTVNEITGFIMDLPDKKVMLITVPRPGEKLLTDEYLLETKVREEMYVRCIVEHALLEVAGQIVIIEVLFGSDERIAIGMKEDEWKFIKTTEDFKI